MQLKQSTVAQKKLKLLVIIVVNSWQSIYDALQMLTSIPHPLVLEMSSSLKMDVSFTISSKALNVEMLTKLSLITFKHIVVIVIIIIIVVQLFLSFAHKSEHKSPYLLRWGIEDHRWKPPWRGDWSGWTTRGVSQRIARNPANHVIHRSINQSIQTFQSPSMHTKF